MKPSRYNVWIERADADYVYNGTTAGVLRVSHDDRAALAGSSDCGVRRAARLGSEATRTGRGRRPPCPGRRRA